LVECRVGSMWRGQSFVAVSPSRLLFAVYGIHVNGDIIKGIVPTVKV